MKYLIILLLFSTCFAYQPINKNYLQNKINLNVMYNDFPELRESNIKLVPKNSAILQTGGWYYPAMYSINNGTIFINKELDPFVLPHAVLHEYGHHVYYSRLSNLRKKQWVKMFEENPVYVSDYSKTNAEENFAEFVAIFYYKRNEDAYKNIESLNKTPQAKFINYILQ